MTRFNEAMVPGVPTCSIAGCEFITSCVRGVSPSGVIAAPG